MNQDGDNDGSVVGWHDGTGVVGEHDGWLVEGETDGNRPQGTNVLLITYTSLLS